MNLLNKCRVYLAGPVERDANATSWRNKIRPLLENFGIIVWDPLNKPNWVHPLDGSKQRADIVLLENYMRFSNEQDPNNKTSDCSDLWTDAVARNKEVRDVGLRLATAADFIICYVGGPTVGTFEEISEANKQRKPILFFGLPKLDSAWRFAQFFRHTKCFFKDIEELIEYLKSIDNGMANVNNLEWIFLPGKWTGKHES